MIIDIHAHTSNHELQGLYTSDASLEYLHREAKTRDIKKIILMATYFPLKKSGLPNKVLLERIKGDPLFACFASLDLENNFLGGLKELSELAEKKMILGIKLYPGYQKVDLSNSLFSPLFRLAEKHKLPVACHLGELHHCCSREQRHNNIYRCGNDHCLLDERGILSQPECLNLVAARFPKVNFIACHLGNPNFTELRHLMAISPNIYTDISGQFLSGTDEGSPAYRRQIRREIREFLKISGSGKILFGTDFPIQSYADTLELITALNLPPADKEKILFRNAQKILNIQTL